MGPSITPVAADAPRPGPPAGGRVADMDLDEIRFHLEQLIKARLSSPLGDEDQLFWEQLIGREKVLLEVP